MLHQVMLNLVILRFSIATEPWIKKQKLFFCCIYANDTVPIF